MHDQCWKTLSHISIGDPLTFCEQDRYTQILESLSHSQEMWQGVFPEGGQRGQDTV